MKTLAGALALLVVLLSACRSAEPMADAAVAAPEVRYYVIADT